MEAIEVLTGGDFAMDMECFLYDVGTAHKNWDKRILKKNLKFAAKIITTIYQIAHAENPHQCSHEDWAKIKYDIIKKNKNH